MLSQCSSLVLVECIGVLVYLHSHCLSADPRDPDVYVLREFVDVLVYLYYLEEHSDMRGEVYFFGVVLDVVAFVFDADVVSAAEFVTGVLGNELLRERMHLDHVAVLVVAL